MHTMTLQILSGPNIGERLFLKPFQHLRIGRTEHADVAFPFDAMLSQVHFRISRPEGNSCQIEDLGSTNGTWINGKPVHFGRVDDGDVVSAGTTAFRISRVD